MSAATRSCALHPKLGSKMGGKGQSNSDGEERSGQRTAEGDGRRGYKEGKV